MAKYQLIKQSVGHHFKILTFENVLPVSSHTCFNNRKFFVINIIDTEPINAQKQ